ncbi:MAG TPA: putative porin, partial [Flavisolibacter sp.]|nr:putative porin [Flavisolibacter sp.]
RPYWNFSLGYRLINSPGVFRNQKTNHNNYVFTSWYQSPSKRYNNFFVILGNRLQTGENGGLRNVNDLDSLVYAKDRFLIPTKIGGSPVPSRDFFTTSLSTGNRYREFNVMLRQQYDLGRKDSIVTDSTVIPLFYPRVRFEHSFTYGKYSYNFEDINTVSGTIRNVPDSQFYRDNYDIVFRPGESVWFRDSWKEITNDFSIYQFPDAKNLNQFIKLGASLQLLQGEFTRDSLDVGSASLYNVMAHGEYRNRTKNRKWDMLAFGRLYLNGYNLGNYHAYGSLQRQVEKIGSLQLGFENINRSPSFIYDQRSGFYLDAPKSFVNENTAHAFASLFLTKQGLRISGDYYLVSNYLYLRGYNELQQEGTIFNVLRINASKVFRIGRRWNLHSEVYIQQKTGGAQVNLPALYTRNRFMYEGNLGFPNLNIAFGVEARYHTPYKADNYSPVLGQFFYQDTTTISNLPDVHLFLHFRIRSFRAYVRAENINTARFLGGFQFNNNNLAAPDHPTPGAILRFGIQWSFVN